MPQKRKKKRYGWDMPEIFWNMSEIHWIFALDMPDSCLGYDLDMLNNCLKFAWDIPKISLM